MRTMSAFVLTVLAFHTVLQIGSLYFIGTIRNIWWTWAVTAVTLLCAAVTPFVFGRVGGGNDGLILVIAAAMAGLGLVPAIVISLVRRLQSP